MGRGASSEKQADLALSPARGSGSSSGAAESKLSTYTVIGIYAEDDQRFAQSFEATSSDDAEQQATDWAEAEIVIAGVVAGEAIPSDVATHIPG
jgi:hypothetical protein